MGVFYAVFDTNVLVSALMSKRADSPTVIMNEKEVKGTKPPTSLLSSCPSLLAPNLLVVNLDTPPPHQSTGRACEDPNHDDQR